MKSIGVEFLLPDVFFWCQPHAWDAVSNSSKYCILFGTQPIQLYTFVCTIPTQNININLHSKPFFNSLLRHTWVLGKGSDAIIGQHHKAQNTQQVDDVESIYPDYITKI